ncbi:MAG: hypothetical protein DMD81_02190 [Candidatus Rokuibacteriota bacterium]|nr:MAG: hypothetical protein DMD81_02190 [Candidatus Rokubacteria bacterium]
MRREFYALTIILTAPFVLHALGDLVTGAAFAPAVVWTAVALVGAALFVVIRFLKKRTTLLAGPRADRLPR